MFVNEPGRFISEPGRFISEPGRFISEPGRFISENKEPVIMQSDWSIRIVYIINRILFYLRYNNFNRLYAVM